MGHTAAIDSGDTAWMLVSTALVMLMLLPGLALFYGGLVRAKNLLSVMSQVLGITGRVPDPSDAADQSRRAAMESALKYMGLTPGMARAGLPAP